MSLERQSAKVILESGKPLKPEDLRAAVKKADFTAGDIRVKVTGLVVVNRDDRTKEVSELILKIPGTGQVFLLVSPAPPQKTDEQKAAADDLLPQLRKQFEAGKRKFTVSGLVHEHKALPLGLTVEKFEVTHD